MVNNTEHILCKPTFPLYMPLERFLNGILYMYKGPQSEVSLAFSGVFLGHSIMHFYLMCIFFISAFALANPHHGHSHGDSQEHHHHSHEDTDATTVEPVIGMKYVFI